MATLHWTPTHHRMLSDVQAGKVEWRSDRGTAGRYTRQFGKEFVDFNFLVALHELEKSGLIQRVGSGVTVTHKGADRLAERGMAR